MALAPEQAKFHALLSALGRRLEDPRHRYFDPEDVLELHARWQRALGELRTRWPSLLGDLPTRPAPMPSGTSDYDGRGYVERRQLERIYDDMRFAADALASMASSGTPTLSLTREGVFFSGQQFDALRHVQKIVASATRTLALVDGYVGPETLDVLTARAHHVTIKVLTRSIPSSLATAARAFIKQYGPIDLRSSPAFHDRFLLIDETDVFHLGASIKDLGARGCMFSLVEEPELVRALIEKVELEWRRADPWTP